MFCHPTCLRRRKAGNYNLQIYRKIERDSLQDYHFKRNKYAASKDQQDKKTQQILNLVVKELINNKPIEAFDSTSDNVSRLMIQSVSNKIVKKILKSNYQDLLNQYSKSNQLYNDPDFKPSSESMGKTFIKKNAQWMRIRDIIPNAQFVSDQMTPQDILQGQLGNCYFLSAIAAIAQNNYRLKNIFSSLEINKNGIYMARVLFNGILQEVVVDDFVPVDKYNKPLFAKPSGGKQIWVMILQKCWAKLFGSYEAIIGGLPNQVLHAFSGAPTFYHQIPSNKNQQQSLFQRILQADKDKNVMCCGTKSNPAIEQQGLVLGHAYTLLSVYDTPCRLLKIRNPWGQKQWTGRASQKDKQFWNRTDMKGFKNQNKNDGQFYMLWEDFVNYFAMVDICKINDNAHYIYNSDPYEKGVGYVHQFEISRGDLVVTLSQPSLRGKDWTEKKKGLGHATVVVAKQMNGQIKQFQYIKSKSDNVFCDFSVSLKDLEPGRYFIYSSVDWTRSQNDKATISLYSEARIVLKQSTLNSQELLYKTYLNHARNNKQSLQVMYERPYQWCCSDLLTDACGFGYLAFHLDKDSSRKIGLQIDQEEYSMINLQLLPPYKGKGQFKVVAEPGKQLIVMFKMKPGQTSGSFSLPVPRMSLLY